MIQIRKAILPDSDALIQLTALTPMKGNIVLRIDRRPDFFSLLKQRGDYMVLVAEDENKKIIGSFSSACQEFIINRQKYLVYYLGDLKVHPDHVNTSLAYRLIRKMHEELLQIGADILICTAASGNKPVTVFFGGRAGIPSFRNVCRFSIYQLLPTKSKRPPIPEEAMGIELKHFYDECYSKYSLKPSVSLENCIHFIESRNDSIMASVSLYDPGLFKQNVVLGYSFKIRAILFALGLLKKIFPLPSLPQKGEALRILYVKYYAAKPGYENELSKLLKRAREYAFEKNFHFVAIATDERDRSFTKLIKPQSSFVFRSDELITSLRNNNDLLDAACKGFAYEDYSLI